MNLRNVLRAYSLLRQLSDDETALLETLRQTNDNERALLVEAMSDKPQKKSSKKSAGGGGRSSKSTRASGMAAQLNAQLGNRRQESNSSVSKCTHQFDSGAMCFEPADANVHHMPTAPNYHPFQPAEQAAVASGD